MVRPGREASQLIEVIDAVKAAHHRSRSHTHSGSSTATTQSMSTRSSPLRQSSSPAGMRCSASAPWLDIPATGSRQRAGSAQRQHGRPAEPACPAVPHLGSKAGGGRSRNWAEAQQAERPQQPAPPRAKAGQGSPEGVSAARPSSAPTCVYAAHDRPGPGWDFSTTGLMARRLQTQAADASVARAARKMQLASKNRTVSRQGQRRALPCRSPRQLMSLCQSSDRYLARAAQVASTLGLSTSLLGEDAREDAVKQVAGATLVRDAKYATLHFSERPPILRQADRRRAWSQTAEF